MKYKAVIFDLDGTILDTLDDLTNALNYCLEKHALQIRSKKEVQGFVGNGIHLLIERAVPKNTKEAMIEAVYQDFLIFYQEHCHELTKPYDGIVELLQLLRKDGYKTAVVSNKADSAVKALCDEYFDGLFDLAVGEKKDVRKKPAPDSVNAVLKQLGVEKEDAAYIGDSEVDIQTAENAGMDCISVTWGFRDALTLKQNGAVKLVTSPIEIYESL